MSHSAHPFILKILIQTISQIPKTEINVKSIDIHAHLTPQCFIQAMNRGEEWHGVKPGTMRVAPRAVWTPEQRLNDMNSLGVDVHVVSTGAAFYFYDKDPQVIAAMHRECNEEVHQMTVDHPDRFKGFAQIPMQDVNAAIKELDHVMNNLGFVGAMINDTADGRTFDEPEYLPPVAGSGADGRGNVHPPAGRRHAGHTPPEPLPPGQHHRQPG